MSTEAFTNILDPNQIKHTSKNDLRGEKMRFRFLVADTPYAIPHKGNRMPSGYVMNSHIRTAAPVAVPQLRHEQIDKIRWNKNIIVLRCTEPGDVEFEVTYGVL